MNLKVEFDRDLTEEEQELVSEVMMKAARVGEAAEVADLCRCLAAAEERARGAEAEAQFWVGALREYARESTELFAKLGAMLEVWEETRDVATIVALDMTPQQQAAEARAEAAEAALEPLRRVAEAAGDTHFWLDDVMAIVCELVLGPKIPIEQKAGAIERLAYAFYKYLDADGASWDDLGLALAALDAARGQAQEQEGGQSDEGAEGQGTE